MQIYQVDVASGARLVGGDMLEWSDLKAARSCGAVGVLAAHLVTGSSPARLLLAGPIASDLMETLAATIPMDVLVRGLPDARQLASLVPLGIDATVYCGGLDRFDPGPAYDLVVALDEPGALLTPDSAGMSHGDVVNRLGTFLRPGGTLIAAVTNELGISQVSRLRLRDTLDDDDQWHRGATGFDQRAPYYREFTELPGRVGLESAAVFAAFPAPGDIDLLVGSAVIDDPEIASVARAYAARLEGAYFANRPALVDPYSLTRQVFDAQMTFELAPAWVLVGRRPSGTAGSASLSDLPLVSTESWIRPEWRVITEVTRGVDGWRRNVRSLTGGLEMTERRLRRDFTAPPPALREGVLLESQLRDSCASGNLSRVRANITAYAAWMRSADAWPGDMALSAFFAVPANVIVGHAGLHLFDPTWCWAESLDPDLCLARGLRSFAGRLLRSGAEHPWKSDISADDLGETLAAMAGVPWDAATIDRVARIESEHDAILIGVDALGQAQLQHRNLEVGASQFISVPGPARGYREALAHSGRMAQELTTREGQVSWLEATLKARDLRVGELERSLRDTHNSVSFRAGRALTYPLRAVSKMIRRMILGALPPNFMYKVDRLVRKISER